ncbi:MAG: hypothetical protein V4673_15945 [Pseudomonadota bacterium]
MRTFLDNTHSDGSHFDIASDPFLVHHSWSAQELADAVRWSPPPLHRFAFAPSANDAASHRPRRGGSFLAMPQWPSRFRIGG